jgi:ABC-2 type transport system ATP-binding protein
MIAVQNLTRRYGELAAVSGVTTSIGRGQIVGLLGHNGAGKTTMMKVLTGYLEPTEGTVTVGGHDVVSARQEAQRLIGYLPENSPSYAEMLVQDYLLMMAALRGVPSAERNNAVIEAVKATSLESRMVQPIGTLSKGLRQRVGLAQAIVHKPPVLILDEPTNGLDPAQIQTMRTVIRKLGETSTILLSTHILQEVEAVCERVLVLMGGRLIADSTLLALKTSGGLRLSLGDGASAVEATLLALAEVAEVKLQGPDPRQSGFQEYLVVPKAGVRATEAVARAALGAGWTLGALAPENRTLEEAFRMLERAEAAKAPVGATT